VTGEQTTPRCDRTGGSFLNRGTRESYSEFTRAARRHRLSLVIGVLLGVWVGLGALTASADSPIRVGLYVQFQDGSTFTQCVEVDTPEATGLDVLRQSGLGFIFEPGGGMGTTICKIGETGCDFPGEDCFCQCLGNPCQYWTYWYEAEGQWKYSPLGISSRVVKDGDVEGWVWGSGQEAPPAEILAHDMCSTPAAATSGAVEAPGETSTLPTTRLSSAPPPTQAISKVEPEAQSASPQLQAPLPLETDLPAPLSPTPRGSVPDRGSPAFIGLVMGMSGLGILLLGLAYFVTRRRS
jgi:hypothetical protein